MNKSCPFCKRLIEKTASTCPYCQRVIIERMEPAKVSYEPNFVLVDKDKPNESIFKGIGKMGGLLGFILIFVVGNILLVGGQKILHLGDKSKLDEMKLTLQTKDTEINNLESRIHSLKSRMDQESSDSDIDLYNSQVDQYNAMVDQYKSKINDYNQMVQQANDLSESIGSTWYIVPISIPK